MSMTMSVAVIGTSHWSYMAKELARVIGNIIEQNQITENCVPYSLYADAKEFFGLVSQYLAGGVPHNPPASAKAYMIATRAIRIASPRQSREEVKRSLEDYVKFFDNIQTAQSLSKEQHGVAISLQKFLNQLYRDGQSESYIERIKFKERSVQG